MGDKCGKHSLPSPKLAQNKSEMQGGLGGRGGQGPRSQCTKEEDDAQKRFMICTREEDDAHAKKVMCRT